MTAGVDGHAGRLPAPSTGLDRSPVPRRAGKAERLASLLDRTGVLRLLAGRRTWSGLLTLTYHRIGDGAACPWDRALYSATQAELAEQMAYVTRHTEVVGEADLHDALQDRPGRRVAVTFDDGYRDNHELALPVLRELGVPAMWFIATGLIDAPRLPWWDELAWMVGTATTAELAAGPFTPRPVSLGDRAAAHATLLGTLRALGVDDVEPFLDWVAEAGAGGRADHATARDAWMTWDHVRALRDAGMGIGGHTVEHPILARCPADRQAREIVQGLDRLEHELGARPTTFAYPVGDRTAYDATTKACLRAAGIRFAFAFSGGHEPARGHADPLALRRIYVGRDLGPAHFRARVVLPRVYARELGESLPRFPWEFAARTPGAGAP